MSDDKSKMLNVFNILKKQGQRFQSIFDSKSVSAISGTSKTFHNLYDPLSKPSELLFYVLNINDERKNQMLNLLNKQKKSLKKSNLNTNSKLESKEKKETQEAESRLQNEPRSIILERVNGRQVSLDNDTIVGVRNWTNVSPLEAAALCGDFHLVQLLLDFVPDSELEAALTQIENVRKKLEIELKQLDSGVKELNQQSGSYVSLIATLRNAYANLNSSNNIDELCNHWGQVGESQKNLSWFLLQMFCTLDKNGGFPNLTSEPERTNLPDKFSVDTLGVKNSEALFRGDSRSLSRNGREWLEKTGAHRVARRSQKDSDFFSELGKIITSKLDDIIKTKKILIDAESQKHPNTINPLDILIRFFKKP